MAQPGGSGRREPQLLDIYLNDHLAAAAGGVALARRAAAHRQGSSDGAVLAGIAAEVAEDRTALLEVLRALTVPVRRYKQAAVRTAERVGRLKPNGHLWQRSPLSDLVELEALALGVVGKAAGWRTLRARAEVDARLSPQQLDTLLHRALRQADVLEELRVRTAATALGGR